VNQTPDRSLGWVVRCDQSEVRALPRMKDSCGEVTQAPARRRSLVTHLMGTSRGCGMRRDCPASDQSMRAKWHSDDDVRAHHVVPGDESPAVCTCDCMPRSLSHADLLHGVSFSEAREGPLLKDLGVD